MSCFPEVLFLKRSMLHSNEFDVVTSGIFDSWGGSFLDIRKGRF